MTRGSPIEVGVIQSPASRSNALRAGNARASLRERQRPIIELMARPMPTPVGLQQEIAAELDCSKLTVVS
jgi:hypothetical protein